MKTFEKKVETAYQVGDTVLIRKDLVVGMIYPMLNGDCSLVIFNEDMSKEELKVGIIESVDYGYRVKEDGYWTWTDRMFEGKIVPINFWSDFGVAKGEEVVITTDNANVKDEFRGMIVKYLKTDELTGLVKVEFEDSNFAYFDKKDILGKLVRPTTKPEATEEIVNKKEKPEVVDFEDAYIPFSIKIERVIFNDPATIVFYKSVIRKEDGTSEESKKIKKVVSKAQDGDIYDKTTGLDLCLFKAFNRESAKMIKKLSK